MSNATQTFRGTAALEPGGTVTIYNVPVPLAATEVSQALSANTKAFTLRVRTKNRAKLQLAFVATESSTKFLTIEASASYSADMIKFNGTLYFQTDKAVQTVEIIEWS